MNNNMGITGFQNTTFGMSNTQVDEASGKIFSFDAYGNSTCIAYFATSVRISMRR